MLLRTILLPVLCVLAACSPEPAQPPLPAEVLQVPPAAGGEGFNRAQAEALLAQAKAEEARNPDQAKSLYRQAGMAWPDLADAWDGLERVSVQRNDLAEAKAAGFMADRVK